MKKVPYLKWIALFGLLLSSQPSPCLASSVVADPILGSISGVRLSISSGDLGYEPVPDLDYIKLEKEVESRCREALAKAGVASDDRAEPFLQVVVHHAWKGQDRSLVALSIGLNISLAASPEDQFLVGARPRSRFLDIWADTRLRLVASGEARDALLEELGDMLYDLGQSIESAR